MSSVSVGTFKEQIEEPDPNFTGRKTEKNEFKKAINAVIRGNIFELKKTKTMFNIFGEGGMGKTSLLLEFLGLTRRSGLYPIHIDIRPQDIPIDSLTDFLIVLRHRLKQLPKNRMLGKNPFREFDNHLRTYLRLLEEKRRKEEDSPEYSSARLVKDATAVGLRIAEDVLPLAKTATAIIGQDKLDNLAFSIIDSIGQISKDAGVREKLLKIFGNENDVDFYLNSEEKFIESMLKAIQLISKEHPLIFMFDSYERLFGIDEYIRERLFINFPRNTILVFSGRNSLKESGNPDWHKFFHYFEMGEFTEDDCYTYLRKHGIRKRVVLEAVWKFTQGVPFAVALAVEAIKNLSRQEEAVQIFQDNKNIRLIRKREEIIQEIIRDVASRFMMLVSDENRRIIYACAVLGRVTQGAFGYLIERKISRSTFNRLTHYSFIRRYGVNFLFHNTARTYILQNLYNESSDGDFKELNHKAVEYYERILAGITPDLENKYDNEEWRRNTLNRLYHLLQSDAKKGLEEFYILFADALWELRIEFCVNLIELAKQPLQTNITGLDFLDTFCSSYQSKNYSEAQRILKELLKFRVDSPYYYQMLYDTLGELNQEDKLNQPPEAIENFEQALRYFQDLGDKDKEATTLLNIGDCLILSNKLHEAIRMIKDSLILRNLLGNKKRIASAEWKLGHAYQLSEEYDKAIEELSKCQTLYRELHDNDMVLNTLNAIARTHQLQGDFKKSIEKYRELINQLQKIDNKPLLAINLYEVSLSLQEDKSYQEAIEFLEKSFLLYEELEQKESMAYVLNQIGTTYRLSKEYGKALIKYEESLILFEQVDNKPQIVNTLYGLGLTFRNNNEYAKAIEQFIKCQSLCIEVDRQKDIANMDDEIAITYRLWHKPSEALETYNNALLEFERLGNKAKIAGVLYGIGLTYYQIKNYEKAVDEIQKSCSICNELGNVEDVAYLHNEIAIAYRTWNRYSEALEYHMKALKEFDDINNKDNTANVYYELGTTHLEWNKYFDSIRAFESSRSIYEQLNQSKKVSELWDSIGYANREWDKFPEAIDCYKQSWRTYNEPNDKTKLAEMHLNFGATYLRWRKFPEAIDNLNKSCLLYKELNQEVNEAMLYRWLGVTYETLGRYEEAIENHEKACKLLVDNKREFAGTLLDIGNVYETWGKYPQAVESLKKSLLMYEELEEKEEIGGIWNTLGALYRVWGKYDEAIRCHELALQVSINKKGNIFYAHYRHGRTYYERGDYGKAVAAFENSLRVCEETSWEPGIVYALHRKGLSLAKLGKKQGAINNANKSVKLAKKLGLTETEGDCYGSLVMIYASLQELEKSRECYENAAEKYSSIRDVFDLANLSAELGKFEAEAGNQPQAIELFNKAISIYREYRRIPQLAEVLVELGKLLRNVTPEEANKYLREGVKLLRDSYREEEANEVQELIN